MHQYVKSKNRFINLIINEYHHRKKNHDKFHIQKIFKNSFFDIFSMKIIYIYLFNSIFLFFFYFQFVFFLLRIYFRFYRFFFF